MSLFKRITASQVHTRQLEDARVQALEARCAAEYYAALASMYEARVERLYGHHGQVSSIAKVAR